MKTIVLGSGIIGTTTAYFLAKAGHEVHVVDRQPEAAMETSFGNGGVLHTSEAEPWSRPGMPRAVLSWIGKENAPMLLRLGALPSMWRWGLDFVRNCSPERYRKAAAVNVRLANHTLSLMPSVRADTGVEYDLMQNGTLKIYTQARGPRRQRRRVGTAARCRAGLRAGRRAALRRDRAGAGAGSSTRWSAASTRRRTSMAIATSSRSGSASTARTSSASPSTSTPRSGRSCAPATGRPAVETSKGSMSGDAYVAALASYAPALLKPLGVQVSIYPAKGVTVTVPDTAWPEGPKVPIIDDTRLFGLIRLGNRFRCSGSVEFNGWDTTASPARAQAIVDNVIGVFPEFAKCYDKATRQGVGRAAADAVLGQPLSRGDAGQEPLPQLRARPSRLDARLRLVAARRRCRLRPAAGDRHDRPHAGDTPVTRRRIALGGGRARGERRRGHDVGRAGPSPAEAPGVVAVAATLRHADPELEALLPTSLGGVALTVESQAGPELSTNSAPFDAFLAGLGKTRADFTLASAYAPGGGLKAEVGAWRVKGADTGAAPAVVQGRDAGLERDAAHHRRRDDRRPAGHAHRRSRPAHPRAALRRRPRRHAAVRADARARARRGGDDQAAGVGSAPVRARR